MAALASSEADFKSVQAVDNEENLQSTESLLIDCDEAMAEANNDDKSTDDGNSTKLYGGTVADDLNQGTNEARFDIVGVHGLHGDEKTWEMPSTSECPGLSRLNKLFSDIAPKGGRFIPYNYNSDEESMECYTLLGVYRSARKLLEGLAKRRTPEIKNAGRPIFFACHDIGGLIVKAAINLASSDESTYAEILHSIRGIIFFGYPHRSRTSVDLEEQLFWLLSLHNNCYQRGHKIRLAKNLAETVNVVNDTFVHSKMLIQARIVNIYSTHDDPAKRVFDKFTATIGITFEYRLPSVKPHLELTDADELDLHTKRISPDEEWLGAKDVTEKYSTDLRKLLHLASPIYPALNDNVVEDNSELEILTQTHYNRILHIQCTSDADTISESVRNYLNERKHATEMLYYFRFKSQDARFNTIPAMLRTFFAHAAYNRSRNSYIEKYFIRICKEQPLEYQFLLDVWEFDELTHVDASGFYVLGCLDECDDSALRFLSRIRSFVMSTERRLRIVIITTKGTTKDKLIANTLSRFPLESISHMDYNLPSSVPVHIGFNVSMLLHEDHRYAANGLRDDVEALISGCSNDKALLRLLTKWLKSTQNPLASVSHILAQGRTPSPGPIFESILADVPEKYHRWAQKLFSWMLSSLRPLRESEFCRISDLCLGSPRDKVYTHTDGSAIRGSFTNIIRHFGGLLVAVHGEVTFSHASMRSWLKSLNPRSPKEWYRQTERDRHMTIVQTCLEHLQDDTDQTQVWAAQLPYATQFWASHYKHVGPIENGLETIFGHQPRLERWIDAYMALPGPFLKPLKTSRRQLPIAAHFGLEDIVKSLLSNTEDDTDSRDQGLIEATRAAQLPAFRLIIERYPDGLNLGDKYVQNTLIAALSTESHELCRELVNHVHLSGPHKLRQPKDRYGEVFAERANDSLEVEYPKNLVHKDEVTTREEATPQESNNLSSCLMEALFLACGLDMADIVAKLLSFGLDNDIMLLKGDSDGVTPLHIASQHSRLDSAKLLIAAGASLTTKADGSTGSPLHSAVRSINDRSGDMIRHLLEQGAPIDAKNLFKITALQMACASGYFAVAEVLLQQRNFQEYITADIQDQPLTLAAYYGRYKVTEALLRHGVDPNIRGQDGKTALCMAVEGDRTDICRLLLAHKANPNLADNDEERSPLLKAVARKNMDIVKLLVENGADVNDPEHDSQRTPVYLATLFKQLEIVQYLLSHNADPNLTDSEGCSPLRIAAGVGNSEMVRLLAEAKADIHSYAKSNKWTAIHAVFDSTETARVLLEYGADINGLSGSGYTPLDLAIHNNQPKALKVMLNESKIKPDLSSKLTQEALQLAVREGYSEVVSLILEGGADVDLVDEDNKSLAALAMPLNDDTMIRTILEYGPDLNIKDKHENTALHFVGRNTPLVSVRRVVNAGGKFDSINKDFETPLMSAISAKNMEVFTYLMTKKLVVDTLNIASFNKEGAPLHFACARGTVDMVKVLIKNGADVNYISTTYGTPLIAASVRWQRNRDVSTEKIVKLLLDEGADPTISTGYFGYPIISASIARSTKIIQWLLDHKAFVDVKDPFGRKPAHFACYNTLEVLNLLGIPDSDFAVKDVVGRVPLHYAVLRGQVDLVEEVLSRSQRAGVDIDVLDDDGWTPLLWAARASRIFLWSKEPQSSHDAVVSFLLSKGANPSIRGRGLYKDWTVSEVAYYHNADSIADLVAEKDPQKKRKSGLKKRGERFTSLHCYCCWLEMSGIYFQSPDTSDDRLCFKCYRSKSRIAPQHRFENRGYDWDSENKDETLNTTQPESAQSANGKNAVEDGANVDIQFDDESVDEDDMWV